MFEHVSISESARAVSGLEKGVPDNTREIDRAIVGTEPTIANVNVILATCFPFCFSVYFPAVCRLVADNQLPLIINLPLPLSIWRSLFAKNPFDHVLTFLPSFK